MDQDTTQQAAAFVERETETAIESTQIVELVTTDEGSAFVVAVETVDRSYWVVPSDDGIVCHPRDHYPTAHAVLTSYLGSANESW